MTHTTPRRGLGRCIVAAVSAVVATAMLLTGCSAAGRSPTGNNAATGRNFGADQSFDLPPKGNFHTLSGVTGSIPTNLGYLNDMIMLPRIEASSIDVVSSAMINAGSVASARASATR